MGPWFSLPALLALALVAATPVNATDTATLETIQTPRGVKQSFLLLKPDKPVATVVLFAGGNGALALREANAIGKSGGNFLVRSRQLFAAHGLMVVVMDAPSDKRDGMTGEFRMSAGHAGDIAAVVQHVRKGADVPVWLVGTSMGTFSAARGALATKGVDGLVLTSTITRSLPDWKIRTSHPNAVASMPLQQVSVPTLLVAHKMDQCAITPAADLGKLKARLTGTRKVETRVLDGGSPPQSEPCEARSQHGFLGIEEEAVATIAAFIKASR